MEQVNNDTNAEDVIKAALSENNQEKPEVAEHEEAPEEGKDNGREFVKVDDPAVKKRLDHLWGWKVCKGA